MSAFRRTFFSQPTARAFLAGIARRQREQASPELRSSDPYSYAAAAINGFSDRHPARVISVPGFQNVRDRAHRDRRDEDPRPAVSAIESVEA